MSDAQEISLYASERFPDRWVKSATLIKDTAIVDATLFSTASIGGSRVPKWLHLAPTANCTYGTPGHHGTLVRASRKSGKG